MVSTHLKSLCIKVSVLKVCRLRAPDLLCHGALHSPALTGWHWIPEFLLAAIEKWNSSKVHAFLAAQSGDKEFTHACPNGANCCQLAIQEDSAFFWRQICLTPRAFFIFNDGGFKPIWRIHKSPNMGKLNNWLKPLSYLAGKPYMTNKKNYSKNNANLSLIHLQRQNRKFLLELSEEVAPLSKKHEVHPEQAGGGWYLREFRSNDGGNLFGAVKVKNRKLEASTKNIAANGRMEPFSKKWLQKIGWLEIIIWRNWAGKDGGNQEISGFIYGLR